MRRTNAFRLLSVSFAALAPALALAAPADPGAPAPLADLVGKVTLDYDRFTLPNGLTVLVHTDRKAPVVAVSVWYKVGSKHEPRGRSGFAHLYEHLMFYGSEHNQGNFFNPLIEVGATDYNGTTWFDRTNYFETVPTGALDRALMMESDRMGWLLPVTTQDRVDAQRAVVKNEKRQDDNQPFGLVGYEQLETLFPAGHPYHHSTIGSMEDLDKASLADVKAWFHDHYGPNNAVLVLAGDIDLATAKDKVAHWFGAIPPGPPVQPVASPIVPLAAPVEHTMTDAVATTRIHRFWPIPGLDNPDYLPLTLGAAVLGGLASSRLDDHLVHGRELAIATSAEAEVYAQAGLFDVTADVKPGTDAKTVATALDAEIARLVNEGPTADELQRAAISKVGRTIRALESSGGFGGVAPRLAEGLIYSGDPRHVRQELDRIARITPAEVRDAMRKWLAKPAFSLTVVPGTRTEGGESRGGDAALPPAAPIPPVPAGLTAAATDGDRSHLPAVTDLASLPFPAFERTTLSNGIKVVFARRGEVPLVSVRLSFDAGYAADPVAARGTEAMLLKLMEEGTETLSATELARTRERLGAVINAISGPDETAFDLSALGPNLGASLNLLSDFVRHPGLRDADLVRARTQQLAAIDAELSDPDSAGLRVLFPAIYGAAHPYGTSPGGIGSKVTVSRLGVADLRAWHQAWLRPDRATLFVVGDTTMATLRPLLEQAFGGWTVPAAPAPAKALDAALPPPRERVLLVDRPGTPQAQIAGGAVLDATGAQDLLALRTANAVLGGSPVARMNLDLREEKGWSYGVFSGVSERAGPVALRLYAPVQIDKTGASIAAMRADIRAFLGDKGVAPRELAIAAQGAARELPGSFETGDAVLDAMARITQFHRSDDYYVKLPARYRALNTADLDKAARALIDPARIVWVVVGDAAKIRPQLDQLGLPVETVKVPE